MGLYIICTKYRSDLAFCSSVGALIKTCLCVCYPHCCLGKQISATDLVYNII